jgi:hypothetical protein
MFNFKITPLIILFIILLSFNSCSNNSPITPNGPPPGVGYQESESKVCMTLSSLCYVNENNPAYLKDSLLIQLSDTNYETAGNWVLDWGPGVDAVTGNMMFVAKDTSSSPPQYAIAIRGTDWCFPINWVEDIINWEFERFAFGAASDSIALGTWVGLLAVLNLTDPVSGQNIYNYLNSLPSDNSPLYITGHSLGGALATALSAWILDSGFGIKFKFKAYTFAAPSIGNASFVHTFNTKIQATNSESHRIVNPKDVVPRFWAEIDSIIIQQLPTTLPLLIDGILLGIQGFMIEEGIYYYNVGQLQTLGVLNPDNCNYGTKTMEEYECWVDFEHSHNTYLTLLNAPMVNVSYVPCDWWE